LVGECPISTGLCGQEMTDSRIQYRTPTQADVADASDGLPWQALPVQLVFMLGEIRLFALKFRGIRSDPDVFKVPALCSVKPPRANLREAGVKCAYIRSCPLATPLPKFSFVGGFVRYAPQHYRHFYVRIHGRFEDYLARFNKKTLSTVKRKVAKAAASNQHVACFATYVQPDEMDRFFDAAIPVSKRSYQDVLLKQGLPDSPAFREQVKRDAAERRIRGYVLFVEDTPVAYNLCPIYGDGVILYDHTGYDPDYSKYSPGTVLQYKTIESLYASGGLKCYDLCTGEGRHKELFATDQILCANVYFFPLTLQHLVSVWSKIALDQVTGLIKFLLDRLSLKGKLKKVIRRRWR
jgi:hypothetical protein